MQFRRGKSADWLVSHEILAAGQPALEYNEDGSINMKAGDGVHEFSDLPYINVGIMSEVISNAIRDLSIPTKLSELTNDTNFITSSSLSSALRGYATTNELLSLANRIPSVSGLEETSNKIDSIGSDSTSGGSSNLYPSSKCLQSSISNLMRKVSTYSTAGAYSDVKDGEIYRSNSTYDIYLKLSSSSKEKIITDEYIKSNTRNTLNILTETEFTESGEVGDNSAWYAESQGIYGTRLEGNYYLIGNMCILFGNASKISTWGEVNYTLPVPFTNSASTICTDALSTYIVTTNNMSNKSVLTIKEINGNYLGEGLLYFTLIYKYK